MNVSICSERLLKNLQAFESDLHLNRMLRKHFQLNDNEEIDYAMFDHLVRKIVELSHAFTGRETIPKISLEQALLLREHKWPTGGSAISKNASKSQMMKDILGKGKKPKPAVEVWMSPFGNHFPNPRIKSSYSFYHDAKSQTSGREVSEYAWVSFACRTLFLLFSFCVCFEL